MLAAALHGWSMAHAQLPNDGRFLLHWGRIALRGGIVLVVVIVLLFGALIGVIFVPTHFPATAPVTRPNPRVKHYYLALGDSLAFGFQPNFNWDQGYAAQWWAELQRHGSKSLMDYGCNGETSDQFVSGTCPFGVVRHNYYSGSQLDAALAFIKGHAGQVSPVSLDIGADDMIPLVNGNTCAVDGARWAPTLANVDHNLTAIILPKLKAALTNNEGVMTGDLVMMNYYDPYANACPKQDHYIIQLNQHLAHDAAQLGVPIVNVYAAFGGMAQPNPTICRYTWMCTPLQSIHPNTTGYSVITHLFEQKMGY